MSSDGEWGWGSTQPLRAPRKSRRAMTGLGTHGTVGRYQRGCRCPDCREAANEAKRRYRDRRRPRPVEPDRAWRANAACAGKPTDWWFAFPSTPEAAQAAAICAGCPVRVVCGSVGRSEREYGRWGYYVHLDRRDERGALERQVAEFEADVERFEREAAG